MPKFKFKYLPCPKCGKIKHGNANSDHCELAAVGDSILSLPIHPKRLEAEGLIRLEDVTFSKNYLKRFIK